ncbi:MAG: hypothetical protein QW757_02645 [Candidatus Woesearchaeota archaeon]
MYIYSNITGIYVFNQNFEIREKILFDNLETEKLFKINKELENKEILETEKKFIEKFKNIKNLRIENDEKSLSKVFERLNNEKNYFESLYNNNLLLTKEQIKNSINFDNLIIQASSSIDELNKTINILVKRLREWYSYCLPEIEEKIKEHKIFIDLILNKTRADLIKDLDIKNSMGKELQKSDNEQILNLAKTIQLLLKEKEQKEKYLETLIKENCPNLNEIAGFLISGKLISLAGSLKNLAFIPSSTVQLLGAEKALFRHMINKNAKPPKHGIIHEHSLLQKASKENKGKVARALADKILLAAKVDYFKGEFIGDKLKKDLEEKFAEK